MNLLDHNREAWNNEVEKGNQWTKAVSSDEIDRARKGDWCLVLTPTIPVPLEWFGDIEGKKILCLASGGGQQGPILAAAGGIVTVLDNSPKQLEQDKFVADRDHLTIRLEQGDMRDLSRFKEDSFDIIFHPVSNCFINEIDNVWKECYRVLKKGGVLLAGFCNPLIYIFDEMEWEDNQKLVIKNKIPYSDLEQLSPVQLQKKIKNKETLEFGHSLDSQIGGQIKAGFLIAGFFEDNCGGDIIDSYINVFIATRAVKL